MGHINRRERCHRDSVGGWCAVVASAAREFGVAPGKACPASWRDGQVRYGTRSRAAALGPLAQPPAADAEVHQHPAGPSIHVEVASVRGGDPLGAGHPVQCADLAVYPAREFESERLGSSRARSCSSSPRTWVTAAGWRCRTAHRVPMNISRLAWPTVRFHAGNDISSRLRARLQRTERTQMPMHPHT